MTAAATPGGETQRSLRSLALPLASAEKLLRRCPCSAQRSTQAARLGDSCYFARCEIVESLLRRGARDFSLHFATQTQQKPLWGRSAREPGLPVANFFDCAPARGRLLRSREPRQKPQRGLAVSQRYFVSRGPFGRKNRLWPRAGRAIPASKNRYPKTKGEGLGEKFFPEPLSIKPPTKPTTH